MSENKNPPKSEKTRLYSLCLRYEQKLSDFLSWIRTWKSSAQALATADPPSVADAPDLEAQLKVKLLALNRPQCRYMCVPTIIFNLHLHSRDIRVWSQSSEQRKLL